MNERTNKRNNEWKDEQTNEEWIKDAWMNIGKNK